MLLLLLLLAVKAHGRRPVIPILSIHRSVCMVQIAHLHVALHLRSSGGRKQIDAESEDVEGENERDDPF